MQQHQTQARPLPATAVAAAHNKQSAPALMGLFSALGGPGNQCGLLHQPAVGESLANWPNDGSDKLILQVDGRPLEFEPADYLGGAEGKTVVIQRRLIPLLDRQQDEELSAFMRHHRVTFLRCSMGFAARLGESLVLMNQVENEQLESDAAESIKKLDSSEIAITDQAQHLVVSTHEGEVINLWPTKVDSSVWDDTERMGRFLGPAVKSATLSEEQIARLREYLVKHDTEAVTDGHCSYTICSERLTICYPERLDENPADLGARAERLGGELQDLYELLFLEQKARNTSLGPIYRRFQRVSNLGSEALSSFRATVNDHEVARQMVEELCSTSGRALLGISPKVEIDTYELKKFALKGFEERSERNHTFFYQRRMSERRGLARKEHDEEEKPVEFDLRAVCRWLVERYAGDAGVRLERGQVAKKLVQELRLERNSCEVKNGRVEFDLWFRLEGYGQHEPTTATRQTIATICAGLSEVYIERGEEPPVALKHFAVSQMEASSTYQLGPDVKLRTFVEKAKLAMSQRLADMLREFIATYSSADE